MAKRIFSFLLCCVLCCALITSCLVAPVRALPSVEVGFDTVDFFQWVSGELGNTLSSGAAFIWSLIDNDVCPSAPSLGGRHNFVERRTTVNGKTGLYYICEYCGQSAGEVGQQAYNDYVGTLPATGWNSEGHLIWQVYASDLDLDNTRFTGSFSRLQSLPYSGSGYSLNWLADYIGVEYIGNNRFGLSPSLEPAIKSFPVSGFYRYYPRVSYDYSLASSSTGVVAEQQFYPVTEFMYYIAGQSTGKFELQFISLDFSLSGYSSGRILIYFPAFEIIPDTALSGDQYNITTRPTGITGGNYGIVGDNGQITTVEINDSIINEINNTYYNPATGRTETVNSWTYDYSTRSYNIILESGDTITVTYGDQNITIVEGGNTYIVYYIINGECPGDNDDPVNSNSPVESDGPNNSDHKHSWIETNHIDPTCTIPGQTDYICEACGHTRVDVLPATGHKWQQKQFVPTTYDDNGNLIQQGYTIYECSVCGEQYKDMVGAGPPGSSSGTVDDGGLLAWINSLIKYLSDHLSGAVELILSFFREIPELFGGFLDFLSAMFPYLPDDVIFLLTFGIATVVFIGIIKALRR